MKKPLSVITGYEALRNIENNPKKDWPNHLGTSGISPIARPDFCPSFSLEPGEKIFTIGSCFARNVERKLDELGFNLPSLLARVPFEEYCKSFMKNVGLPIPGFNNEIMNKYIPFSILNELKWVFDDDCNFPFDDAFLKIDKDLFFDPHSTFPYPAPWNILQKHRKMITNTMRHLENCRVVVITLGLTEAWWDNQIGIYLNFTPPKAVLEREPERFTIHLLSYEQILACMRQILEKLERICSSNFKVLLTVSPVPLHQTYFDQDILCTNMYSKSVLRAVAQQIFMENDNVDYFPSFESVMLSDRATAWRWDARHVTDEIVRDIIFRMVKCYLPANIADDLLPGVYPKTDEPTYSEMFSKFHAMKKVEEAQEEAHKHTIEAHKHTIEAQKTLIDMQSSTIERLKSNNSQYLRQINEQLGIGSRKYSA